MLYQNKRVVIDILLWYFYCLCP